MSRAITEYLTRINDSIFLPGLQREFVWTPEQIEDLFDSLIRGYPIGIITEWQVQGGQVADYNSYQFLESYIAADHQPPAAVEEAGFTKYNEQTDEEDPDVLIIDGQQRLNSLWIGVCGEITEYNGGSGYPKDDPANWEAYQLCIDLFAHPEFDRDDTVGDYSFEFKPIGDLGGNDETGYSASGSTHRLWMPVGELWIDGSQSDADNNRLVGHGEMRDVVDSYVDAAAIPADEETRDELRDIAKITARDLRGEVLDEDLNTDSTSKGRSEIPEIFQRLNMEGSDPKPYQLFMSRLMSYWPYADDSDLRINPREEIEDWIDAFQEKYPEYEQDIDRRLFLRYSAYLIGTDLLRSNLSGIEEEDMDRLRECWLYDDPIEMGTRFEWFRRSLEKAFQTVLETGIRRQVMSTMPVFALLGQFYYQNPEAEVSDANRNAVFRFLAKGMLLDRSYGVLTYGKCRNWMRYLHEWEPKRGSPVVFPGEELFDAENLSPSPDDIRRAVENTRYEGELGEPVFTDKNAVAVLGLIEDSYTTSKMRDISDYQVDHIFPVSRADEVEAAVGGEVDLHKIGNLQLLPQAMNEGKGTQWPQNWMDEELSDDEAAKLERVNQYPEIELRPENAAEFIEKRQQKLIEHLIDEYVK